MDDFVPKASVLYKPVVSNGTAKIPHIDNAQDGSHMV